MESLHDEIFPFEVGETVDVYPCRLNGDVVGYIIAKKEPTVSTSLYWDKAPVEPEKHMLDYALRNALNDFIGGFEGLRMGQLFHLSKHDAHTMGFLRGLEIAGIEDADELLAALREHSEVVLWVE